MRLRHVFENFNCGEFVLSNPSSRSFLVNLQSTDSPIRTMFVTLAFGALVMLCMGAQPTSSNATPASTDSDTLPTSTRCSDDMQLVADAFCIDRYEASTAELASDGKVIAHSPYLPVTGLRVKALSRKGVVPQAYISRNEAQAACAQSHKRLCTEREWATACKGHAQTTYPYGNQYHPGYCVDTNRVDPLRQLFQSLGSARYQFSIMNDARLNQVPGTLAPTGSFSRCTNEYEVYDMVGNLHEWTSDPRGTFRGGFYLDSKLNGSGCDYRTVAHPATYHDYSTGFRCCADAQ